VYNQLTTEEHVADVETAAASDGNANG